MDKFSLFDLEQLTGIKAHTIRVWEQRYGILVPKREPSNHRYYDNDDLKRALKIAALYKKGVKISQIACLTETELKVYNKPVLSPNNDKQEMVINLLLEKAMELDDFGFNQILNQSINFLGQEKAVLHIFFPLLIKIGQLWLHEGFMPIQEHFASLKIRNKIISFINMQGVSIKKNDEPGILLFTPPNEQHEIPLLFIHFLMCKYQRNVHYIGCSASNEEIAQWVYKKRINKLWFNSISNFTGITINEYIQSLLVDFKELNVVVSGSGAHLATLEDSRVAYLKTPEDILQEIHFQDRFSSLN